MAYFIEIYYFSPRHRMNLSALGGYIHYDSGHYEHTITETETETEF